MEKYRSSGTSLEFYEKGYCTLAGRIRQAHIYDHAISRAGQIV